MSASDAITDLEQAASRIDEEIAVEEARDERREWRQMNLNAVRRDIRNALIRLKRDQA